jgi:3-methylcrotonyl-CoA carboxylase beta subunit
MGSCTAGGAYVPAMSDEAVIVKGTGTIFLGGPPLVKAATGEEVTAEELGGADVHTRISGVADYFAEDDEHAISLVRNIVENMPATARREPTRASSRRIRRTTREIYGVIQRDIRKPYDVREVIARIVDGSLFHEFKERYATTLVTGFARIFGYKVGISRTTACCSASPRSRPRTSSSSATKEIPWFSSRTSRGSWLERVREGRIAKDGAKMVHAVANSNVPKFTVIIGGSFGAGNYGMCGRAYDPRFLWMWPNARISVMGGEQAAGVLVTVKRDHGSGGKGKSCRPKKSGRSRTRCSPSTNGGKPVLQHGAAMGRRNHRSGRHPHRPRARLSISYNAPIERPKFGVFRM